MMKQELSLPESPEEKQETEKRIQWMSRPVDERRTNYSRECFQILSDNRV
jgi:hypothetical protein